jgi:hypothetical protein
MSSLDSLERSRRHHQKEQWHQKQIHHKRKETGEDNPDYHDRLFMSMKKSSFCLFSESLCCKKHDHNDDKYQCDCLKKAQEKSMCYNISNHVNINTIGSNSNSDMNSINHDSPLDEFLPQYHGCRHYRRRQAKSKLFIDSSKSCLITAPTRLTSLTETNVTQSFSTDHFETEAINAIETESVAHDTGSTSYLDQVPNEILGLIESYISPSSIVSLTLTCSKYNKRWKSKRWQKTFCLHYGIVGVNRHAGNILTPFISSPSSSSSSSPSSMVSMSSLSYCKNRYEMFYKQRYGTWENSFIGNDGDENYVDNNNGKKKTLNHGEEQEDGASTTFNRSSLLPSLRKSYRCLWYKIELSMLGLKHDDEDEIVNTNNNRNSNQSNESIQRFNERHQRYFTVLRVVIKILQMLFLPLVEYFSITLFPKSNFVGWRKRRIRLQQCQRPREDGSFHPNTDKIVQSSSHPSFDSQQRKTALINPRDDKRKISNNPIFNMQNKDIDSMNAWKLACLLKENGVNCIRCRLCNEIDVIGSSKGEIMTWITPCYCPEPVHRKCLEAKLGLVQSLHTWEVVKLKLARLFKNRSDSYNDESKIVSHQQKVQRRCLAPQIWVSYDSSLDNNTRRMKSNVASPIHVDDLNQFTSPIARCDKCTMVYSRALRLPHSILEVLLTSLSDNLSILRAISTFVHFLLCIVFIGAVEAKYNDNICDNISISLTEDVVIKWPRNVWKGAALAWWQLQQCCMLHIFFSPRFVAIVDRLWIHSGSTFYIKLYVYFACTSAVLALSFLPFIGRQVKQKILKIFMDEATISLLSPIWDFVSFLNLIQYAVSSTTVIIIFWRTNYRVYTAASRKNIGYISSSVYDGRRTHGGDNQQHVLTLNISTDRNESDHPIYHGQWQ